MIEYLSQFMWDLNLTDSLIEGSQEFCTVQLVLILIDWLIDLNIVLFTFSYILYKNNDIYTESLVIKSLTVSAELALAY